MTALWALVEDGRVTSTARTDQPPSTDWLPVDTVVPDHDPDTHRPGGVTFDVGPDRVTATARIVEIVEPDPPDDEEPQGAPQPDRTPTWLRQADAVRTAARLTVDSMILAAELDDATVAAVADLYDPWRPGVEVAVGDLYRHDGTVVECVQAHTTQADWTPPSTPALWKVHRTTSGATPDEWVQPTGSHDAYGIGDRVTFEGAVWESTIDGNVWSPTGYPAGWTQI